jgi:hypothetical protein
MRETMPSFRKTRETLVSGITRSRFFAGAGKKWTARSVRGSTGNSEARNQIWRFGKKKKHTDVLTQETDRGVSQPRVRAC